MPILFTIGYQGLTPDAFVAALTRAGRLASLGPGWSEGAEKHTCQQNRLCRRRVLAQVSSHYSLFSPPALSPARF